jgi:hypothetical protein
VVQNNADILALLDWAINLMADVVINESFNKMNARNMTKVSKTSIDYMF